jgi:hypothetical protein
MQAGKAELAPKLADEGASGLDAGVKKAEDEARAGRKDSMDSSAATTLMDLSTSMSMATTTASITTTTPALPLALTLGEGTGTISSNTSGATAGDAEALNPNPSPLVVAAAAVETDDTGLALGEGNTTLTLTPPSPPSSTEALVDPATTAAVTTPAPTAIVSYSAAAAAAAAAQCVTVPSPLPVLGSSSSSSSSISSSSSSSTTISSYDMVKKSKAIARKMDVVPIMSGSPSMLKSDYSPLKMESVARHFQRKYRVCRLTRLPSSLAVALSSLRPHCTEMVVYAGSNSSSRSFSSSVVSVGMGALKQQQQQQQQQEEEEEEEYVLIEEGGVVVVANPDEARTLLPVEGRDTVTVFPAINKADLVLTLRTPPPTPMHTMYVSCLIEASTCSSLLVEAGEREGGVEDMGMVSAAGLIEGEGGREGGEERVEEVIDAYLSVAAEGEQVQSWEEFFASTPPPAVSPSFLASLCERVKGMTGSIRKFIMRLIEWVAKGFKVGKKGSFAAVRAVVEGGRAVMEGGRSIVEGGRAFIQECVEEHFPFSSSSSSQPLQAAVGGGGREDGCLALRATHHLVGAGDRGVCGAAPGVGSAGGGEGAAAAGGAGHPSVAIQGPV